MNSKSLRHPRTCALRCIRNAAIAAACALALHPSIASPKPQQSSREASTLREAGEGRHITIGTAAAARFLDETDYSAILGSEFGQLQAENEMKFGAIHPRPDTDPIPYNFTGGDGLIAFAQNHKMPVRGHTLVWHNHVPDWMKNGGYAAAQQADVRHFGPYFGETIAGVKIMRPAAYLKDRGNRSQS